MTSIPFPRLLILDCDGVLIRSEEANRAYYNHLFGLFGLPPVQREDEEPMRLLHTLSTPQVIDSFFPENLRENARLAVSGLEFSRFSGLLTGEEGWDEVLDDWKARGIAVCVATNRGKSASDVLSAVGLVSRIDRVFTIHDVAKPKPAPDLLLLALKVFGVESLQALYVGDSALDEEAARKAQVPFVGFRFGTQARIETPRELTRYLQDPAALTPTL